LIVDLKLCNRTKILKEPSYNGDTAKHEINLIDFKYKKVVETTNFVNLMQEIQKFLQEKARKLEEKGLLPKPTPPMFYMNYAKKTLTMNFYYEKQQ
jgi:hypothetical protein